MKLPVKSIAMLAFVSKPSESIIRGKYFTDQYMARPRLLFRAHRDDSHMFQSCSQEDPSYDHEGVNSGLNPNLRYVFSPPIRGLICGRHESDVLVGNPSTGDQEKAWRMVKCKHPHRLPCEVKGVFVNGVVYYYAYVKSEGSIISFNLNSEEFNVIRLPEDLRFVHEFSYDLVNYNGNVALASTCFDDTLDLRILDASKQEWSNASVDVPSWRDLIT
ncbi:unnamed protein product [Arabis nemorensis]|uniref:F-box associated beta-propeller type 3 domain-containing protein n=1 Tax=Arabis nemorensis TaxID=586526 RepID=A0A565B4A0_9BRAS|nr:unnamed protein product [Arabis nemorensis]